MKAVFSVLFVALMASQVMAAPSTCLDNVKAVVEQQSKNQLTVHGISFDWSQANQANLDNSVSYSSFQVPMTLKAGADSVLGNYYDVQVYDGCSPIVAALKTTCSFRISQQITDKANTDYPKQNLVVDPFQIDESRSASYIFTAVTADGVGVHRYNATVNEVCAITSPITEDSQTKSK